MIDETATTRETDATGAWGEDIILEEVAAASFSMLASWTASTCLPGNPLSMWGLEVIAHRWDRGVFESATAESIQHALGGGSGCR